MTEDLNRGVSEDTSAEVEGAEGASSTGEMSTGASFTGTEGSQQLIGQASVVVARPGAGQTVQISAELGQTYVIDFDPAAAQVSVEGDNLVMTFADGGRIVIQGLGSLTTEPGAPTFSIAGTEIEAGTLFGQAIALSGGEADPEAAATLEVAAGTETIPSGGVGLDDSGPGDSLDLLNAQGVIAPVERDFGLIDLEVIDPEFIVAAPDTPPSADPVLTSADSGTLPPALSEALSSLDFTGVGGAIFVTGHDSEEHRNGGDYMTPGLDFLAFGHAATGAEVAARGDLTVAFLNPSFDARALAEMRADGWVVTFFDLDSDFSAAFSGDFDLIMVGSGDGSLVHRDALFAAKDQFADFINGGGGLYINTDEGLGQTWYDFVPAFGTALNNPIDDAGVFAVTAEGLLIGLTDSIVNADFTHSFYTGVDTSLFTVFEVTDESFGEDAGIPIAFGARDINISDGGFVTVGDIAFFKQLTVDGVVGDGDIAQADFGGLDAETPLSELTFTLTSLPNYGTLILVTAGGATTEMAVGDTFTSADTVWWVVTESQVSAFLELNELEALPEATFTYSVTDADGNTADASVVVTIDDLPSVGEPQSTLVDEDGEGGESGFVGLPGSIPGGDGDASPAGVTDSANLNYDFGADGAGDVSFAALDGTAVVDQDGAAVTSRGDDLTWSWDGDTHTLTALNESGDAVLTLQVTDVATGDYEVTLLDVLDHPDTGDTDDEFDDIVFGLDFVVTDADGDAASGTVTVTVDDDSPVAANDVDTAEVLLEVDSNIVIVFDRSGSMTVDPNVAGFSQRIDLARAAIASLLAGADSIGTANVLIIDFATAANSSGWMTVDEANAYLSALVAGGRTNYEVAADAVQAAFPIGLPGGAEQNLLYWLSDGNPTTGDFTGSEVSDWETFLTANDMQAIAVGIGSGATESGLDPVAFPNDDPDNPIILTDEIDLLSTLIVPLPVAASGNVLDNDEFGADGEDTPAVVQFVHDSILYTPATPVGGTVISNAGGVIVIVTALGAEFEFDFNTGAYAYAGSTDGGGSETFEYIIQDGDGDRSTAVLTIDVPPTPDLEGLPLIAGDDGGIVDDTLDGTDEAEILAGGGGDDTLNGGGGNDVLFGGDGDDTLNGGPGDDNLLGGPGDDSIFSSLGSDTINVGADNSGGGARPDLSSSQDTVFYTNVLHAGDVIDNFDAAGSSHDVIDLDGLFDNLGVADADRAARVSIVDSDTDQQQVLIDTNGDSTFDLTLVTVNLISGDLNDWLDTGEIVVF